MNPAQRDSSSVPCGARTPREQRLDGVTRKILFDATARAGGTEGNLDHPTVPDPLSSAGGASGT